MTTFAEIAAKLETQFARGIITADEYASELMTTAANEGKAAINMEEESKRLEEERCPYVITTNNMALADETVWRFHFPETANYTVQAWQEIRQYITRIDGQDGSFALRGFLKEANEWQTLFYQVKCVGNTSSVCPCVACRNESVGFTETN